MSDYRELLIGCGSRREKDLRLPTAIELSMWAAKTLPYDLNQTEHGLLRDTRFRRYEQDLSNVFGAKFRGLETIDNNPSHKPDYLVDLSWVLPNGRFPMIDKPSFEVPTSLLIQDSSVDEIHAYEVLEHIGAQGDYSLFFAQFSEFYRMLKPGGLFFATCPSWKSMWAWGDPSHKRVITSGSLTFLSQAAYHAQVGKTPMSDFRHIYMADFEPVYVHEDDSYVGFVLRAIK